MATKQRYPLSTASGQAIPLDVLRPTSLFSIAFSSSSATSPTALPAETELIRLKTTADCFIRFANSAVVKPDSAGTLLPNTLYLKADETLAVSPSFLYYSVIGDTTSGILMVQILETWAGLGLEHQYQYK